MGIVLLFLLKLREAFTEGPQQFSRVRGCLISLDQELSQDLLEFKCNRAEPCVLVEHEVLSQGWNVGHGLDGHIEVTCVPKILEASHFNFQIRVGLFYVTSVMVSVVFIPALAVAVMTAVQIAIQKHVVQKLSHHMIFVIGALVYGIMTMFYIAHHQDHLSAQMEKLAVPLVIVLVFASILGFLANMMYTGLIRHGQIAVVSALTSTVPIFVSIIAFLVLGEALNPKQMAGIGAIVGGTILLS